MTDAWLRLVALSRRTGLHYRAGGRPGGDVTATLLRPATTGSGADEAHCGIGRDLDAAVDDLAATLKERGR